MERKKEEEMNRHAGDYYGPYCNNSLVEEQQEREQESYSDCLLLYDDDSSFTVLSPLQFSPRVHQAGKIQNGIQEVVEPKKENQHPHSLAASLKLLANYDSKFTHLNTERVTKPSTKETVAGKKLSTEEILRIAGGRFIRSCTSNVDVVSMLNNPFELSVSGLSREEDKHVELVEFLLASAEKVGNQQFDRARTMLDFCHCSSSNTGDPIERIVYYFSEALQARIDIETGKFTSTYPRKSQSLAIDHLVIIPNSVIQACYEGIPFYQTAHLTGIQAIIENVAEAKRIHVIDLKIRNGMQWIALMQALVSRCDCPLELLKITAVETSLKHLIVDTGKQLMSFAQAMNIPFSFKIVVVADMLNLKEDLFEIDTEEVVAVYSEYALMNFIVLRDQLENVMRVIRNIKPCIMVVIESEANHNSPTFVNRFVEALFYFSAYFDCVDACLAYDENRKIVESLFLGEGIRNIVASEG